MEWGTLVSVADKLGVISMLILILVSGVKGWWVFGWVHRESREREKEWKDLALTGTKIAEHLTEQRRRARVTDG